MNQLPYLKSKFPKHADYAGKQIAEIIAAEQLSKAVVREAYTFASMVFYGDNDGTFQRQRLPAEAQFSPVFAVMAKDFNADGVKDLLLAGNFHGLNPQLGRYDASYGTLLSGSRNATFKSRHSNSHVVKSQFLRENSAGSLTPSDGTDSAGHTPSDSSYPMEFAFIPMRESGLFLTGQARDVVLLKHRNKQEVIIIAKNNDRIQVYEMNAK
jgi:hypothetical protein